MDSSLNDLLAALDAHQQYLSDQQLREPISTDLQQTHPTAQNDHPENMPYNYTAAYTPSPGFSVYEGIGIGSVDTQESSNHGLDAQIEYYHGEDEDLAPSFSDTDPQQALDYNNGNIAVQQATPNQVEFNQVDTNIGPQQVFIHRDVYMRFQPTPRQFETRVAFDQVDLNAGRQQATHAFDPTAFQYGDFETHNRAQNHRLGSQSNAAPGLIASSSNQNTSMAAGFTPAMADDIPGAFPVSPVQGAPVFNQAPPFRSTVRPRRGGGRYSAGETHTFERMLREGMSDAHIAAALGRSENAITIKRLRAEGRCKHPHAAERERRLGN